MIPIILLFLKIVLSSAQAENDIQQSNGLRKGQICLFTCSDWVFKEKIQQFAPSANLLGPGYLSNHKVGLLSNDPKSLCEDDSPVHYQRVWGAVYSINKSEYDNVLKQSQIEYSIPFASHEDVFVVEYEDMNCLVVDLGIQPGDHLPWRNFHMKVPNATHDGEYFNRLAQIGVPRRYIEALQNASVKPQYHPIIPQDFRPKPTNGQIPTNGPIIGQIPETHNSEPAPKKLLPGVVTPGSQSQVDTDNPTLPDTVQSIPTTLNQPSEPKKLLPVVVTRGSQPPTMADAPRPLDTLTTPNQPSEPKKILPGVVTPGNQPQGMTDTSRQVQGNMSLGTPGTTSTTLYQPSGPKKLLPGVVTPGSQPQGMTDTPRQVQRNIPLDTVEPAPDDLQVTVPEDIDTNDQPTVVIHPMKLSKSSSDEPLATEPNHNWPYQPQVSIPKKDNSNVVVSPRSVILTTQQHKAIDNAVFTKVTNETHLPTTNEVNPTVSEAKQTPVDDQSRVVTSPLKLPQSQADLTSPAARQDYVVEIPPRLQPDDTVQQTIEPKNIDNDSTVRKNVPPILLSAPKQSTGVEPDHTIITQPLIIQQPPKQDHIYLTSDVTAPPRLPLQPHILINPSTQPEIEPMPQPLPTSYDKPSDHDVPSANSGLLTLSPSPDMTPTYQNDSPLLTLNADTPQLDHSTLVTTPNDSSTKPVQQVVNPSVMVGPSPDKPTPISRQFTTNTPDWNINPDLLKPHSAPDNLQISPPNSVYAIPPSYGVPKAAPVLSDKPMFEVPQSNQPNKYIVHSIPTTSPDLSKPTPLTSDQPNNHIVRAFPTRSDVPKPVSIPSDKPMFALDQPKPNLVSHQIIPNTIDLRNSPNPDQLLTNTAPSPLQLHPNGDQPVYSIPPSYGTPKPAPILQVKPMFSLDKSNHPSTTIPASYGVDSPPVSVKDAPMFTLDDSPSLLQPKQIDEDNYKTPIPAKLPNPDDQVNNISLTGPPPDQVPLTTTTPNFQTIQQPNHVVDNSKQVTLGTTSNSRTILQQSPNPVVDNTKPVTLASQPDSIQLTTQPTTATVTNHSIASQSTSNASSVQTVRVSPQAPSTYTPSNFMVSHYTPSSSALGYSFGYRFPQYLNNCNYKPPNTDYGPYDSIPGYTFAGHIQLYD